MTQAMVCQACGAGVPHGRLSCPACGSIVASVAGEGATDPRPTEQVDAGSSPAGAVPSPDETTSSRPRPASAYLRRTMAGAPPAGPSATPGPPAESDASVADRPADAPSEDATSAGPPVEPASSPTPPPIIGEWAAPQPEPPPRTRPQPPDSSAAGSVGGTTMPAGPAMPPSASIVMGSAGARQRRFGELLFPELGGTPDGQPAPANARSPGADEGSGDGRRSVVPDTLPRQLVIAGAIVAGVSFLLPWADVVLGGTSATGGYLAHWGLANSRNILLVLGLFAVGWLAWWPTSRLAWLRLGVLPIIAGAALLGIVWPYMTSDYGARLGMWLTIAAAGLLIGGGIAALAQRTHHDPAEPPV